jgi:endonuclease/exonuclease/phosphatase family metal-dependent hydrolase
MQSTIRFCTYNVHKCRGWDGRVSPERIARVLAPLEADCIALQEVIDGSPVGRVNQAQAIADELNSGYKAVFGRTRDLRGSHYGNATLTKFPVESSESYNLSWRQREPRGCLRTDLRVGSRLKPRTILHVFNVHLGTSHAERRAQGPLLLSDRMLNDAAHTGPRLILGDFNEWTRGLTSELMLKQFRRIHPREHQRRHGSFPGPIPVLDLDHIYFDDALEVVSFRLIRNKLALIASDHLPLVAEFRQKL